MAILIHFMIRARLDEKLIESKGREVVAWIVFANEKLYQASDQLDYTYAQVVFNLAPDTPENRATLERIAGELREFKPEPGARGDEQTLGSVIRTHVPGWPLRVPARVAGREPTYTASPHVYWSKLPNQRLTRPYISCKVVVGKRILVQHVSYPADVAQPGKTEPGVATDGEGGRPVVTDPVPVTTPRPPLSGTVVRMGAVFFVLLLAVGGVVVHHLITNRQQAADTPDAVATRAVEAMENYARIVDGVRGGDLTQSVYNDLQNTQARGLADTFRKLPLEQRRSIEVETARRVKQAAWRYSEAYTLVRRRTNIGDALPENWLGDFDVHARF